MKLHYYLSKYGNFGDDLNPWLWNKLLPDFFDDDPDVLFVGIGTLLSPRLPSAKKTIVFGSGAGYGPPPQTDKSWDIACVRGPETAKLMRLPSSSAVTDPAILVRLFNDRTPASKQNISFMPHHLSCTQGDWEAVCHLAGFNYIDARGSVDKVLQQLKQTKLLITEAMHGAIVADALRIPWIAVHSYDHILPFKWIDWMSSLNLNGTFQRIDPVWYGETNKALVQRLKNKTKRNLARLGIQPRTWMPPPHPASSSHELDNSAETLNKIALSATPQLSDDILLESKQEQLLMLLEQTKQRYKL